MNQVDTKEQSRIKMPTIIKDLKSTVKGNVIGRYTFGGFKPPQSGPKRETFVMPVFKEERSMKQLEKDMWVCQDRMRSLQLEKKDTKIKKSK